MRHLFLPACLCLVTWSAATGSDPNLPPDKHSVALPAKVLAKSVDMTLSAREKLKPDLRLVSLEAEPPGLDTPPSGTLGDIAPQRSPADTSAAPADATQTPADTTAAPANTAQVSTDSFEPVVLPLEPLHRLMAPYDIVTLPPTPLHALLKPIVPRSRAEICKTLTRAARKNDLPTPFFIRLLFQESEFKQGVISPAGAQGIAQFMPETAADRGLDNPFDPLQAIPASARLLRDLFQKFGNLGLAAAAYNAGPKRILDWLANKAPLPQETHDYVKTITGRPPQNWTEAQAGSPALKLPRRAPCQEAAGLLAWNGPDRIPLPPPGPRTLAADKKIAEEAAKQAAAEAAKKAAAAKKLAQKQESKHNKAHRADNRQHDSKTAGVDKKVDRDEHTAKAEKKHKHHADSGKQASRRHNKHRDVRLTER
jgi:Transglycosylase SLT domain